MSGGIEILIAKNIKTFRKAAGLSQAELAKRACITSQYLSLIETNKRPPTLQVVNRIADIMDIPIVHFFINQEEIKDEEDLVFREILAESYADRAIKDGSLTKIIDEEQLRNKITKEVLASKEFRDTQELVAKIAKAIDREGLYDPEKSEPKSLYDFNQRQARLHAKQIEKKELRPLLQFPSKPDDLAEEESNRWDRNLEVVKKWTKTDQSGSVFSFGLPEWAIEHFCREVRESFNEDKLEKVTEILVNIVMHGPM